MKTVFAFISVPPLPLMVLLYRRVRFFTIRGGKKAERLAGAGEKWYNTRGNAPAARRGKKERARRMDQRERLDYLVEAFKEDSVRYRDLETPEDPEEKKRLLRSRMNIRMPGPMPPGVLKVQDEYLRERIRENGFAETDRKEYRITASGDACHGTADR